MAYFPFFVDIGGKPCLIVGGGTVALRKIEHLLPFGPDITVIAPRVDERIRALNVRIIERGFEDSDLNGCFMAIAATDDAAVNQRVYELSKAAGIPINSVDDIENCTFIFPSLVKKGPLTVGISTSGTAPGAAKMLRKRLETDLDDEFIAAAELYARHRPKLKGRFKTEAAMSKASQQLMELCLNKKGGPDDGDIQKILERAGNDEA